MLGTKFKMVEGYRGAGDIMLAMQRGEVQAVCMSLGQFRSHEQMFKEGKFRSSCAPRKREMAQAPGVPSIFDYAKTEEQRQLMRFIFSSTEFGRPYLFPPDVPKDRVQFMRKAIARAVNDPELMAEAAKSKLDMTYRPPEHLEKLVNQLYETPPALIETAQEHQPELALGPYSTRIWRNGRTRLLRSGDAGLSPPPCPSARSPTSRTPASRAPTGVSIGSRLSLAICSLTSGMARMAFSSPCSLSTIGGGVLPVATTMNQRRHVVARHAGLVERRNVRECRDARRWSTRRAARTLPLWSIPAADGEIAEHELDVSGDHVVQRRHAAR